MNDSGEIVGMVDVLKLTYATLEQINTMQNADSEGPAWNKFWMSLDHETESMVSGEGSLQHTGIGSRSLVSPEASRERMLDSVAPGDSASHVGAESPPHSHITGVNEQSPEEVPFTFKFKAPSGRVHRLQVISGQGISRFVTNVSSKLGAEAETIGGTPGTEGGKVVGGYALSYLDDDGDTVSITTDQDLLEAIVIARQAGRDKVDLLVHDPDKPSAQNRELAALPALPAPPTSSTPSNVRQRRRRMGDEYYDEDGEDESDDEHTDMTRRRKRGSDQIQAEQAIPGVPNELLLPGAIVALAVVIVSVFTIARVTAR